MADAPKYTAMHEDRGIWGVFDPTGHRIAFYAPDDDGGDLCEELAEAHAAERTFELRFMADFLGLSPQRFIDAETACRHAVDARIGAGAL
jgi:hypothetical protein